MQRVSLYAIIGLTLATSAAASDWRQVTGPAGGATRVEVDFDSLTTDVANQYHGVMKNLWMRRSYPDRSKDVVHMTLDCDGRRYLVDSASRFAMNGSVTKTYVADNSFSPIPPDTDFDAVRRNICT